MTNFLIILFGATMLYAASSSRVETYIKALAAQGVLLFLMVISDFGRLNIINLVFLCVETLVFKAVVIPWLLTDTVRRNGVFREDEPYIPNFFSLAVTSLIFASGLLLAYWAVKFGHNVRPLYFGISASAAVAGLYIIMSKKKIMTHVVGYVMMENGIFLLSLSMAGEMPMIVNGGVLLDVFAAVFLLGLFASKVNDKFEEMDIDSLTELKD